MRCISFTYDQVETALVNAFRVPDDKVKALRARLRHYANLGIAPAERPGKGKHISYKFEDAVIWAIALDFSHLGFGPRDVVGFLQHRGTRRSLRKVVSLILQDIETGTPRRYTVALIKIAPLFDESMPSRIRVSLFPRSRLEIDVNGDDHIAAFNITAFYGPDFRTWPRLRYGHARVLDQANPRGRSERCG